MKKVLFVMVAMLAIGLTSCGNKAKAPADESEAVEATINADEEATATINALSEQIEAKDANKLQEVLNTVKEKVVSFITSDPEAAKAYVIKVQEFLKENTDKIKEFVGDNETVNAALSALTDAPADNIVSGLASLGEGMSNAADDTKEAIKDKAEDAKDAMKDKAEDIKDDAKDAMNDAADKAKKAMGM